MPSRFEQHVRHCLGMQARAEQALEFKDGMAAAPVKDVRQLPGGKSNAVAEALEHAEQSRNIFSSSSLNATGWFHQIKRPRR